MSSNPLQSLADRLPDILERAMDRALEIGLEAARARMRPGGGGPQVRSGNLLRSLGKKVTRRGDTVVGEIYADAPYASAQEHGAVIQAKKAKWLRFKVQGRWVQVNRVVLPARPYLRPGGEAAVEALKEAVALELQKELA